MTHRQKQHRPIMGGIGITPHNGMSQMGTLTAVARRNSDNALVFVTNTHVVSPSAEITMVTGAGESITMVDRFIIDDENAYMYQHLPNESDGVTDTQARRIGQLYKTEEVGTGIVHKSWLEVYRIGAWDQWNRLGGTTTADLAALKVLPDIDVNFGVHYVDDENDNKHTHRKRPIVAPSVAPANDMKVVIFGARTGRREATVKVANPTEVFEMVSNLPSYVELRFIIKIF